jgi:glutamate racemase
MDKAKQAIGIFDSGAGGLTVASAVRNILPEEKIIYFGDTAHLPYGDKSNENIQKYALRISDFLLKKECKVILIACNTASAAAYEKVKEHVGNKIPVLNVIDPAAEYVAQVEEIQKIGIIGTKATIRSNSYPRMIKALNNTKTVVSLPTPLFAPMIEEGFVYDDISNAVIRKYLSDPILKDIDSLVLGCTHYPIIKNQIRKFYEFETMVIDASLIVAKKLRELLKEENLLNNLQKPAHEFFVSDYTESFKKMAEMFFDTRIELQQIEL